MKIREIEASDNASLANLIRRILKGYGLDIPGTAYFDEGLDHLSDCYKDKDHRYFVLLDDEGVVAGGVGFSRFPLMDDTAELQKLYIADRLRGTGTGRMMLDHIENSMREAGFKRSYLETHSNLKAAIHLYEKAGYREIERPKEVVHSTMDRFFVKEL